MGPGWMAWMAVGVLAVAWVTLRLMQPWMDRYMATKRMLGNFQRYLNGLTPDALVRRFVRKEGMGLAVWRDADAFPERGYRLRLEAIMREMVVEELHRAVPQKVCPVCGDEPGWEDVRAVCCGIEGEKGKGTVDMMASWSKAAWRRRLIRGE